MSVEQTVRQFIEENLEEEYFIVEIKFKDTKPKSKLGIWLDGDKGITIDKCAKVSRALGSYIEENDIIKQAYNLEVSSAGVDTPLKFKRQYKNNIGRLLRVSLDDGENIEGKLVEVSDDNIKLEIKEKKNIKLIELEFEKIQKAKVLISFN